MAESSDEIFQGMEELETMMTSLLPMVDEISCVDERLSKQTEEYRQLRSDVDRLTKKTSRMRKKMQRLEGEKKDTKKEATAPSPWATISYRQFCFSAGADLTVTGPQLTVDASSWPDDLYDDSITEFSRMLIQRGVRFTCEDGDVCVRCLSDSSVFVHSLVCNELHRFPAATVIEVPTGHCVKVFRKLEFARLLNDALKRGYGAVRDLGESCAIKVSFGGVCWGEECERKEVTGSPCWIEMHLRKPMSELNEILRFLRKSLSVSPPPAPATSPGSLTSSCGEGPCSCCAASSGSTALTIPADSCK